MSDVLPLHIQRTGDIPAAILLAVLPAGLVAFHIGWPTPWQGLSLPLAVAAFGLIWALWMVRRTRSLRISVIGLGLWGGGVHLAMWIPLLFTSYASGQGIANLGYSVWATLVTATIVAWYVLGNYLWQTLVVGLALVAVVAMLRARPLGEMKKQD